MSRVLKAAPLILSERGNILTSTEKPTNSKANPPPPPRPKPPTAPKRANPWGRRENSLPAVRINSLKVHRGSPRPDQRFNLQREYLCSYQGGPLGGSWSGLPWLSYTSRGRKLKIRFLTSSPQRASWCLESRLTHHHGFPPFKRSF